MKHVFYFLAIFAIIWEVLNLVDANKLNQFRIRLENTKKDGITTIQKYYAYLTMSYTLWTFAGLFTFQWPVFLFMILIGLILGQIGKLSNKLRLITKWIDSLISFFALIFLILNAYHFKVDVLNFILPLLIFKH